MVLSKNKILEHLILIVFFLILTSNKKPWSVQVRVLRLCGSWSKSPCRQFYLIVWGQRGWEWFLDQNFVLNLKIHILQTADGGLWVKSAFWGDFGPFSYVNLHNVSFFSDQCQIMTYVVSNWSSQPWEFIHVQFWWFQWLPWQQEQRINQKQRKMDIFCNLCDT